MLRRIVAVAVVEHEPKVRQALLRVGVVEGLEALLDGAHVHGLPDDGVVVVEVQPDRVHRRLERRGELVVPHGLEDVLVDVLELVGSVGDGAGGGEEWWLYDGAGDGRRGWRLGRLGRGFLGRCRLGWRSRNGRFSDGLIRGDRL